MKRGLESRGREIWLPAYRCFVRAHLEYCAEAYSPYYTKACSKVRKGSEKGNQTDHCDGGVSYEDRLREP